MGHAGGNDDRAVRQRRAALEDHAPGGGVDGGHRAQHHPQVALAAEDPADRRGDVGRRQAGGGDLIQQRLEDVMVVPVDHRHLDGGAAERAGRRQAGEATAHDHDLRPFSHRAHASSGSPRWHGWTALARAYMPLPHRSATGGAAART